jgi:quercetin dioxygenase-like cupin family protein
MNRLVIAIALALLLAVSARWAGHAQQDDPRFTGRTENLEAKDIGASRRRFAPGARTAWHSHDKGQLLFFEPGRARLQRKGGPIKEFKAGESDFTPANVVHWHGAAPDGELVQVAVGFGGETRWLEKVSDAAYSGKR